MKRSFIISLVFINILIHSVSAFNPPSHVIENFKKIFPNALKVKWSVHQLDESKEYLAEFVNKSTKYTASFDQEGNFIEVSHKIGKKELPLVILNTLIIQNGGDNNIQLIEAKEIMQVIGETKYQVTIKLEGNTNTLLIDMRGNFTYR